MVSAHRGGRQTFAPPFPVGLVEMASRQFAQLHIPEVTDYAAVYPAGMVAVRFGA